jgi:hypothetical protein
MQDFQKQLLCSYSFFFLPQKKKSALTAPRSGDRVSLPGDMMAPSSDTQSDLLATKELANLLGRELVQAKGRIHALQPQARVSI